VLVILIGVFLTNSWQAATIGKGTFQVELRDVKVRLTE